MSVTGTPVGVSVTPVVTLMVHGLFPSITQSTPLELGCLLL